MQHTGSFSDLVYMTAPCNALPPGCYNIFPLQCESVCCYCISCYPSMADTAHCRMALGMVRLLSDCVVVGMRVNWRHLFISALENFLPGTQLQGNSAR